MTYFDGIRDASGNINWELSNSINPIFEGSNIDIENEELYLTETEKQIQTYFF